MAHIHSYTHVLALTHKALENLWNGTVYVSEKIDGSQVSFFRSDLDGELCIRSHNAAIDMEAPGMFDKAVAVIKNLPLRSGWTYRGEYLRTPKHNTLAYDRVPKGNIILFDIDRGDQSYLEYGFVAYEAIRLGLEVVPQLGVYTERPSDLASLLDTPSILGGQKVEGIVCKNYRMFGEDGKVLMGKLVREDFKEVHKTDWKQRNPSPGDFVETLAEKYHAESRWRKAVQHLAESGALLNAPQDIPAVLREVNLDVLTECKEEIADALFSYYWKRTISRIITKGVPDWYKNQLAQGMEKEEADDRPGNDGEASVGSDGGQR
jgi:hypothetical protein